MFRFKQFTIRQDQTSMKVCTDACIFGAFIEVELAKNILDIGTGTGLLALMIAQRTNGKITAVEIEENAYNQAVRNVAESIFSNQIEILRTDIRNYATHEKFDLIVSNPPFFQRSLKSPDNQANMAHHGITLSFDELIFSVKNLLKPEGKFVVLLPPFETKSFEKIAINNQLYPINQLLIKHSAQKKTLRVITTFSQENNQEIATNELLIYEPDNQTYTANFRQLLKDYYLIF